MQRLIKGRAKESRKQRARGVEGGQMGLLVSGKFQEEGPQRTERVYSPQ